MTARASIIAAIEHADAVSPDRVTRIEYRLRQVGALNWARVFCAEQGIPLSQVAARGRSLSVARVRHRLWSVMRDTLGLSYPELGQMFDVDHTTVLHGCRRQHERLQAEHR